VSGPRVFVLDEDRDLEAVVPEGRRDSARDASVAATLTVPRGLWDARRDTDRARGGYGVLLLEGLLIRRVGVEGRFGSELLSAGDLLRPWQSDGEETTVGLETVWRVLVEARLALLDPRWARRMAQFPEVGAELAGRALERSRRLAATMAIARQPRLEDRLWMLFRELADRHGRVHPDGIHVDLPLTHEVLSDLAVARRPSVSAALSRLVQERRIRREGRGWVLHGEPPSRRVRRRGGGEGLNGQGVAE
jgi:hypothetical protein